MAIISFGRVDKKLIIIIFVLIVEIIDLIISYEIEDEYSLNIITAFIQEIGAVLLGIILLFIFKQKLQNKESKIKRLKYFLIFLLLKVIKHSYEKIYHYFIIEKKYKWSNLLNTINGIEILLVTIGTFFLLKYKYYIHHYISMIIFCILGIICDFILGGYFIMNYKYIYIYLIYLINDVFISCYIKYMMDKLYYHYAEILLYWGLTGFISKFFIYLGLLIYEYKANINDGFLAEIKIYFTEENIFAIIFFQFFYILFLGGVYYLLIILMLFYLRPNHMIITDEITIFIELIFYDDKPNKYYTLIPFFFQILALLFYFEILELNFLNLNENTIKNIQHRERKENEIDEEEKPEPHLIEIGDQYYLKDNQLENISEEEKHEN
mgnify:CR=1 FL=1